MSVLKWGLGAAAIWVVLRNDEVKHQIEQLVHGLDGVWARVFANEKTALEVQQTMDRMGARIEALEALLEAKAEDWQKP